MLKCYFFSHQIKLVFHTLGFTNTVNDFIYYFSLGFYARTYSFKELIHFMCTL